MKNEVIIILIYNLTITCTAYMGIYTPVLKCKLIMRSSLYHHYAIISLLIPLITCSFSYFLLLVWQLSGMLQVPVELLKEQLHLLHS